MLPLPGRRKTPTVDPVHSDVPGMLPGPFPYSLAVRTGDTVRTAGIVGIDYTNGQPRSPTSESRCGRP